jgi:hypothetical protein
MTSGVASAVSFSERLAEVATNAGRTIASPRTGNHWRRKVRILMGGVVLRMKMKMKVE